MALRRVSNSETVVSKYMYAAPDGITYFQKFQDLAKQTVYDERELLDSVVTVFGLTGYDDESTTTRQMRPTGLGLGYVEMVEVPVVKSGADRLKADLLEASKATASRKALKRIRTALK